MAMYLARFTYLFDFTASQQLQWDKNVSSVGSLQKSKMKYWKNELYKVWLAYTWKIWQLIKEKTVLII